MTAILFVYDRWSLCCDKFINVQYPFFGTEESGETFSKNRGRAGRDIMCRRLEAPFCRQAPI